MLLASMQIWDILAFTVGVDILEYFESPSPDKVQSVHLSYRLISEKEIFTFWNGIFKSGYGKILTVFSLNFCVIAVYIPFISLFTTFHDLFDCMLYDRYQENTDVWVVT